MILSSIMSFRHLIVLEASVVAKFTTTSDVVPSIECMGQTYIATVLPVNQIRQV